MKSSPALLWREVISRVALASRVVPAASRAEARGAGAGGGAGADAGNGAGAGGGAGFGRGGTRRGAGAGSGGIGRSFNATVESVRGSWISRAAVLSVAA
jgi:hypothetical protein